MTKVLNYIDGRLVEPASKEYFDNFDPAIGAAYGLVPDSDERDLQIAVDAAKRAWPNWRRTLAQDRAAMLAKLADLVEARLEEFARAECVDTGKPLSVCRNLDIPRAVANLRAFAAAATELSGQTFDKEKSRSYTLRQPIGIVSTISPWNLPLLLFTWKLAPALAVGNCAIA